MNKYEKVLTELKDHIIELTNYDPSVRCRKRGYVNSRMLFCKIIDDKYDISNNNASKSQLTSEMISCFLKNAINRTIVSRNIKEIENVFITDKELYEIYIRLRTRMKIPTDIFDRIDVLNMERKRLLSELEVVEKNLTIERKKRDIYFGLIQ